MMMALARLDIPGAGALRRLDRPRPLSGQRCHRRRMCSRPSARTPPARSATTSTWRHRGKRPVQGGRLRRPVHGQHDVDRHGVHRPLADRLQQRPGHRSREGQGRLRMRAPDHGAHQARPAPEPDPLAQGVRKRHRLGGRDRRLDQRRAAPAGAGARGRRRAAHRRLRCDQRAHARDRGPQALGQVHGRRYARRRRHPAGDEAPARRRLSASTRSDRHRPDPRRSVPSATETPGQDRHLTHRATRSRSTAASPSCTATWPKRAG